MRRFVSKIGLLAGIVVLLQAWVGNILGEFRLPPRDRIDAHIQKRVDVLLLGDSVATYGRRNETDPRTLEPLLQEQFPSHRVGLVAGPAYFMDVHLAVVEHALEREYRPRIVLVPVNLRSFSPLWDLHPAFQYRAERLRLRWGDTAGLGFLQPLASYRLLDRVPGSEKEWLESPVFRGSRKIGTVDEVLNGRGDLAGRPPLERLFTLCYMGSLDRGHRHVKSLLKLVKLCREAGIRPVVYVTPIDVQNGERWIGPDFRKQAAQNVEVVRSALAERGEPLLDLAFSHSPEEFAWNPVPNEHLSAQGRAHLAKDLARAVREGEKPK